MHPPDPYSLLDEIDFTIRKKLIERLQIDEGWKKLAMPILGNEVVQRLQCCSNPAERLMEELDVRMCTVGFLAAALEEEELYDALALVKEREPLSIIKQPGDGASVIRVNIGEPLELECSAVGFPPPKYQWFLGNQEIASGTNHTLLIESFEEHHQGEYSCLITQDMFPDALCWSETVFVELLPEFPEIVEQPKPVVCVAGEPFTLHCSVACEPTPNFQWYRGNELLKETTDTLKVNSASCALSGSYKCCVSNLVGQVWSNAAQVTVYPQPDEEYIKALAGLPRERDTVTAKIALLVANETYSKNSTFANSSSHQDLSTPCNDVETLANILKQMGFRIIALQNLTKVEMMNALKEFGTLLRDGCYGVFYFAGHGFECGDKYMVPVDAPGNDKCLRSDCVSERDILQYALSGNPRLLLVILDMCLQVPDKEENPFIFSERHEYPEFQQNRNLIQAYATSRNQQSFEKGNENGLYVKYLKKWLGYDMSILTVLNIVMKEFEKESSPARNKQMPSVTHNTTKDYFLTDPVVEIPEIIEMYEKITSLQHPTKLHFRRGVPLEIPVATFQMHRNCFHNCVVIRISHLLHWIVKFTTTSSQVCMNADIENGDRVLTISGLQRVKTKILTIDITLYDPSTRTLLDECILDLQEPLIVSAHLWIDLATASL